MKSATTITIAACLALSGCGLGDDDHRVVGELASDRIELAADVSEPIVAIEFDEGQSVSSGQVLLRQDAARARARLAEAEAALAGQQARLDELVRGPRSEQIDAARANLQGAVRELEFRRSEMTRVTEVHERGLASPEALDRAKAALDAAIANHKLRQAQLEERLAGTTVEELAQAEQAVSQHAARRASAAVDLERHTIRSPVDGIVDSRLFELGERPGVGQPLVIVLGGEQPYARVYIPERLRARVAPGLKARIHVDGLETPIDGQLRWVSSEAAFTPYYALTERDRGRLSFVAKVDIAEDRQRLPDGLPVEVELLLEGSD